MRVESYPSKGEANVAHSPRTVFGLQNSVGPWSYGKAYAIILITHRCVSIQSAQRGWAQDRLHARATGKLPREPSSRDPVDSAGAWVPAGLRESRQTLRRGVAQPWPRRN